MANAFDAPAALLRLGVAHGTPASNQVFDLGGMGTVTNEQVFDIVAPLIGVFNSQVFDIDGVIRATNNQVFDLGEVLRVTNEQVFDIIAIETQPDQGVPQLPPVILDTTSLDAYAIAGQKTALVDSVASISIGSTVFIGQESFLVTNIVGNRLTFSTALLKTYPTGTAVVIPAVSTTTTATASVGATSVTVTSATGLTVGMAIGIRDIDGSTEYRVISGIAGLVISFSVPLGGSYAIGSGVGQAPGFLTGISVFDKAGVYVGTITDYTINESRSYAIRESGSMSFYVPRNSPDVALIKSDRLVAVTNSVGLPLWAGTIGTESWSGGTGTVNVEDVLSLLVGVPIEMELFADVDTPAGGVYQMVLDRVNARRGIDNEIQWGLDATGVTKLFMGDLDVDGDPLDIIDTVADRSQTEYAWRASIVGNQLYVTLVVSDAFDEGFGVDLIDGDGGNVVESPDYQVDPTTIINGLRLNGETTTVALYTEDWAEWAVYEVEPSVEVFADAGDFRRRIDLDISVDWSLSKRTQMGLAQKTEDDVWALYERYLYALHDIQGRINDEGYVYEGPPESIEPGLTADKWRTHLELAKYRDGRPITLVMRSDSLDSWVTVSMNFSANIKTTAIFAFNSLYYSRSMNATLAPGDYTIYTESGGRAEVFSIYNTAGETFQVDLASINAKLANGSRISLRAIKRGSPLAGRYLDLREPTITITEVPPVPNIDAEGSQVANIWPRERQAIRNWDPRRDGTGSLLSKTTVYSGALTTRPRWHLVPYSTGEEAETRLSAGLFYTDLDWVPDGPVLADVVFVDSGAGFPLDDLPFDILVGDPLFQQEIMRVYATFGNRWNVYRGISAAPVLTTGSVSAGATVLPVADTTRFLTGQIVMVGNESATIDTISGLNLNLSAPLLFAHPSGTSVATAGLIKSWGAGDLVRLVGGTKFEGFKYPYTWPEGEIYAAALLERLRYPTRLISINITNENDDWSTVKLGSFHDVNIATEGPPGGVVGTVRVVGMSPDEDAGTMELVLEVQ